MYKQGYKLLKNAGFWQDFNNFADQNEYIRPLLYGGIGAGAGVGLGALMGRRDRWLKMLLGGTLGAGIGAGGGLYHNTYRSQLAKARDAASAQTQVDMQTAMQQELQEQQRLVRQQMDREQRREKLSPRFVKRHPVDQAPKEIQQANDFYNAQQEAQAKGRSSKNKNTVQNSPSKNDEQQAQLRQQQRHIDAMTAEQQKRDMLNSGKIKQSPRAESNTYSQGLAQIQQANDFYNAQQQAQGRRGNSGKRNKSILDSKFPLIYNWLYDIPESSRRSGFYNMVDAIGDDPNQAQYDQTRALYDSMRNRGLGYLLRH